VLAIYEILQKEKVKNQAFQDLKVAPGIADFCSSPADTI